ncbi:MAG: ribosome rescue GTPase HflX [Gammaproteobacteria bacterium]|jgi:GTP-binding protein HflX
MSAAEESALLLNIQLSAESSADTSELSELVVAAGLIVVGEILSKRTAPDSKFYVGKGKAEEVALFVKENDVQLVICSKDLSPVQQRNLEKLVCCTVIDRTGLILDIFAQRARSFEGKLQVELAQLEHLSSRLVRGWSHLERQKGGIGLRGPGETQLETDRRLIGGRIKQIKSRLNKVKKQRFQNGQSRKKALLSTVALVGYTNAGKSTLFNKLTGNSVYCADQLFATLDTTIGSLVINGENPILLSDTVGFVKSLPHNLVEAFAATLDETREAKLLLHIIDASDPARTERIEQVNDVLQSIGASEVPVIEVYNKIDKVSDCVPHVDYKSDLKVQRVWISAEREIGLDLLLDAISEQVNDEKVAERVTIKWESGGKLRAMLYEWGAVTNETLGSEGEWVLEIVLSKTRWQIFTSNEDYSDCVSVEGRNSSNSHPAFY